MEQEYTGIERRKSSWKKYRNIGITAFLVVAAAVTLVFFFYRMDIVFEYTGKVLAILAPVLYGILFAFLLNPIMSFFETKIYNLLKRRLKKLTRAVKLARILGIIIAVTIAVLLISLLIYLIAPELTNTVMGLAAELPNQFQNFLAWFNGLTEGEGTITEILRTAVNKGTEYVESFIENDLTAQITSWLEYIANGVFGVFEFIYNIIIGLVFSIYMLANKENFAGQAKKFIYATFKPHKANSIIITSRRCHKIFNGAIVGKVLDSAIVGVLCFVGMTVIGLPYPLLISVMIGTTNVIPFFGPFIGAVPSALLILVVDPLQCLYFIIFIIILQQIDCNILDPRIVGGSIGLSAFWVLFACILFGGLFGLLGLLLGVPTFACIYYVVKGSLENKLKKKGMHTETDDYIALDYIELVKTETSATTTTSGEAVDENILKKIDRILDVSDEAENIKKKKKTKKKRR